MRKRSDMLTAQRFAFIPEAFGQSGRIELPSICRRLKRGKLGLGYPQH